MNNKTEFNFTFRINNVKVKAALILAMIFMLSCFPITAMNAPKNSTSVVIADASGDASGDPCWDGHFISLDWDSDGTQHWHSCAVCGQKFYVGNHTGSEATCVSKAVCSECGISYGDIDPDNHSFTNYVSNDDATCTKDGTKTAKCDRCNVTDTVTDAGSAKGHAPGDWKVIVEPTYRERGTKAILCTRCLEVLKTDYIPKKVNPFKDMDESKWYFDACMWNYDNSYMSGTGKDTFSPNEDLTRAQFVQIIAKVDGVDLTGIVYKGGFSDVKTNDWFAKAVQWATDNGIAYGVGAGKFSPNSVVTREQLATFMMAYSAYRMGPDTGETVSLDKYKDASDVSGWALNAVKWAVANGLISGTTTDTLSPKASATRAQTAVIIRNFAENYLSK